MKHNLSLTSMKGLVTTGVLVALGTTIVLATGNTPKVSGNDQPVAGVRVVQAAQAPQVQLNAGEPILAQGSPGPVIPDEVVKIPLTINESELILEQPPATPDLTPAGENAEPGLLASVGRLEAALENLQQLAEQTRQAVAALERQHSLE